ncbi:hypothetical protein C7B76_27920 [filamentous cyanobacterium CCP2]|nr:hypothetical protein C7B76_27920 [filamentous cyanobacterium CCP2]
MNKYKLWAGMVLGVWLLLPGRPASALPGQTVEEVAAWIQAHPTLQPASGETLLVRKTDTPARRFSFEAVTLAPGRAEQGIGGIIRMEQMQLFDRINGVSRGRLENSLQVIYDADIFEDYQRARVVYRYPTPETFNAAQNQRSPLLASLRGEVRQGDRFAYWLEIAQTEDDTAYSGQITVFLVEDIEKLVQELQSR